MLRERRDRSKIGNVRTPRAPLVSRARVGDGTVLRSSGLPSPMGFKPSLDQVREQVTLDVSFLTLMASSGVLAAVALLTNSVPLLIGSMVVAPLLSPLELVSFATVQRRWSLVVRGAGIAVVGIAVATLGAVGTTVLFNVTDVLPASANLVEKPLLEERVRPGWYSVIAAIAAGVAGSVATVQNRTDVLVGAVAALALVPAAAAGGIALLSRTPELAMGGLLLLVINVALIVLTGIVTLSLFDLYHSS